MPCAGVGCFGFADLSNMQKRLRAHGKGQKEFAFWVLMTLRLNPYAQLPARRLNFVVIITIKDLFQERLGARMK
jgi:hypothetical protein